MRTSDADLLFIPNRDPGQAPGRSGAGPDHWQTRWSERLSTARMIDLPDPRDPSRADWTAAIVAAITACERPVVLVAHALGAIAAVHAVHNAPGAVTAVRAAILVAPPSERALKARNRLDPDFLPTPRAPLPFPALVIGSRTDPEATIDESQDMALDWGAQFVDAGEAGRIDAASGHGPWPEGLMRIATFLARL